jgi:hypothetical protein
LLPAVLLISFSRNKSTTTVCGHSKITQHSVTGLGNHTLSSWQDWPSG